MPTDEEPAAPTPDEIAAAFTAPMPAPVVPAIVMRVVPAQPRWMPLTDDDGQTVHILPRCDVVPHDCAEDCVCGPTASIAPNHEGHDHPDIWVHQHHALDGRVYPDLR